MNVHVLLGLSPEKKTFQPDMRGQRFPEDTAYHQIHCTYYHCVVKTIIIHSIS